MLLELGELNIRIEEEDATELRIKNEFTKNKRRPTANAK